MFIFVRNLIINMLQKYYLVIIVLFLLPFAHAQYLRGTVVDKDRAKHCRVQPSIWMALRLQRLLIVMVILDLILKG